MHLYSHSVLQGCELNQELYEQALREVHPLVLKTFEARGQRLTFPPDRWVLTYICAVLWVMGHRLDWVAWVGPWVLGAAEGC